MGKKTWYLPSELVVHNMVDDIWVCMHGKIFDLTSFVRRYIAEDAEVAQCNTALCRNNGICICNASKEIRMILAFAGKDVSHWFQDGRNDYVKYTHAVTTSRDTLANHGTWPQLSGVAVNPKWRPPQEPFWFDEESFFVGYLTKNPRPLRIINTHSGDACTIEVCDEETIYEIMEFRYLPYNRHYLSYTWTYMGSPVALDMTLKDNGVRDDRHCFGTVSLSEDTHVPALLLYYNDDCTEDLPDPE